MESNNYRQAIEKWFEAHKDEMIEAVGELVSHPSVSGAAEGDMPFGKKAYEGLMAAKALIEKKGFEVKCYENAIISADLNGGEPTLGILAHTDVVPEGTGWDTDPYKMEVKDGMLWGRGTADDKGPAVAALYAMCAAREIEPNLTKNCRIILGSSEETGMTDLPIYEKYEKYPPMVFSPDSGYPVTNLEKGKFGLTFNCGWVESKTLPRILSIKGGTVSNIVPREATAVIEGLDISAAEAACKNVSEKFGAEITYRVLEDGSVEITAHGKAAHASAPFAGLNAHTLLISVLTELPIAECDGYYRLKLLGEILPHGDYYGKSLGVACEDEVSGKLTMNFGVFEYGLRGMSGNLDMRTPVCADSLDLEKTAYSRFGKAGIACSTDEKLPSHYVPADSPFVQTLMRVYKDYTGLEGEPIAAGGLTYAHGIPGAVAFGCELPGSEHNIHSANERFSIHELMVGAKIFTQIILDLGK